MTGKFPLTCHTGTNYTSLNSKSGYLSASKWRPGRQLCITEECTELGKAGLREQS